MFCQDNTCNFMKLHSVEFKSMTMIFSLLET